MVQEDSLILPSCIPLPIEDGKLLNDVIDKAKDWALMHGAAMRSKDNFNPDVLQFAPFILTPSSFPRAEFEKAQSLQPIINELMHNVAHDTAFLRETLANAIIADDFTGNLFKIYERILLEGINQDTYSLGLLRSDYLADTNEDKHIKQVEINTVASSFGGISTFMKPMHRYILQELGHSNKINHLPENLALSGICTPMYQAWILQNNVNAVILFVIENITYNICDQRFHEFYLRENHPEVQIIRKTLTEIYHEGKLNENGELVINDKIVSVIYFRAGYVPDHYPTQKEWDARYLMEKSKAIKCPSIQYHLAGTKKVQQALAKPGILTRFLREEFQVKAISDIFTGLYTLDDTDEGDKAAQMALTNPERFVMKPQREGGGHNIYGDAIPDAIKAMSKSERSAWILMDLIAPPITKGYMIRPGGSVPPPIVELVSELGIFGAIIGTKDNIIYNKQAGHMLRTKLATANEGGVAAGLGALDSPYLFDEN